MNEVKITLIKNTDDLYSENQISNHKSVIVKTKPYQSLREIIQQALSLLDPEFQTIGWFDSDNVLERGERKIGIGFRDINSSQNEPMYLIAQQLLLYTINSEGLVGFSSPRLNQDSSAPIMYEDLLRAQNESLSDVDYRDIIIYESEGGFGGWEDASNLIEFFESSNIIITVGKITVGKIGLPIVEKIQARRLMEQWETRGIKNGPAIRRIVERREKWTLEKVANLFGTSYESAKTLLDNLGYEKSAFKPTEWIKSSSPLAESKLQKWKETETLLSEI